jgi:NAD(P)-dependent dehydrogenase (short-subunit alcohol dehydrogenase family)
MIHTPFTASFLEGENGRRLASIGATIPLKLVGGPEDLVGGILYLARDISRFTTGQTIVMDGGWT